MVRAQKMTGLGVMMTVIKLFQWSMYTSVISKKLWTL